MNNIYFIAILFPVIFLTIAIIAIATYPGDTGDRYHILPPLIKRRKA